MSRATRNRHSRGSNKSGVDAAPLPPSAAGAGILSRRAEQVRYVAVTLLLMAALYGVYYYSYSENGLVDRALTAHLRVQAALAGMLIQVFDRSVSVAGTVVQGRFPIQIVKDCSSLDAQALLVAAVAAFPATRARRLAGVIAGVIVLNALNLLRIAGLYYVGVHAREHFDTVHEEVMPLFLIAAAALSFCVWITWARTLPQRAHVASP